MANPTIGSISRAQLAALLPETLEIRESQGGKKFPLYVATPFGSWFLNTPAGQKNLRDALGAAQEAEPVVAVEPEGDPPGEPDPAQETELEPVAAGETKKPGFFSGLANIFPDDDNE